MLGSSFTVIRSISDLVFCLDSTSTSICCFQTGLRAQLAANRAGNDTRRLSLTPSSRSPVVLCPGNMVFIIRVQTPQGTKRLMFKDEQATWKDLQLQIKDVCKVEPASQVLSRTPMSQAQVGLLVLRPSLLTVCWPRSSSIACRPQNSPQLQRTSSQRLFEELLADS